jgi:Mg2+/Co2+ transporter CorC
VHRIPSVGEVLSLGPYAVTVLEADRRRILTLRITPPEAAARATSQPH